MSQENKIHYNGKVGINISDPKKDLEVGGVVVLKSNKARLLFAREEGPNYIDFNKKKPFIFREMNPDDTGHVNVAQIKEGQFHFNKNITVAGSVYQNSDISLKQNVKPLEENLSKICSLSAVAFEWKEDGRKDIGLVAQEVEKEYPKLVKEENGIKSIEYTKLIAPLIAAIKDLKAEKDEEIACLKQEIRSLQNA
jgi:hypothetical protein